MPGACVFVGDFNAPPHEPAYEAIASAGFVSAHAAVHGSEPERTFPTGLQAPTMDTDPPLTTDYIWLAGGLAPFSCELAATAHAVEDPTLVPSDHFALVANADWK